MSTVVKAVESLVKGPKAQRLDQVEQIKCLLEAKNASLLTHNYFIRCREDMVSEQQLIGVVKQLYCFSIFFERLIARRVAEYSSSQDPRIIEIARKHIREEIGHAQMFRDCLLANGVSPSEIDQLAPAMFTKALFGYLTATIQHENEYVSNIAIMQVMEGIGYHFFSSTLKVMEQRGMLAEPMVEHTAADEDHSTLGLALAAEFDKHTMKAAQRVIEDIYRLMSFVLDEWLGNFQRPMTIAPERKRRTTRPPKSSVGVS